MTGESGAKPPSLAEFLDGLQVVAEKSVIEMADGLGVGEATLQRWLDGEIPSAPSQLLISEKLKLPIDEFESMLDMSKKENLRAFVIRAVAIRVSNVDGFIPQSEIELINRLMDAVNPIQKNPS